MLRPTAAFATYASSLLCASTLASGCDDGMGQASGDETGMTAGRCASDTRPDMFALGLAKTGSHVTVTLADAVPATPFRGDNSWLVAVTDVDGVPMDGATLAVNPWMPDHGHGSSVPVGIEPQGDGTYDITPLNLWMAGYWEITFTVTMADQSSDEVMMSVCVE